MTAKDEKKKYVEDLNIMLKPMKDFDEIKYAAKPVTCEEFIKISDKLGGYVYLDITGETCQDILKDVCRVVLNSELSVIHFPKRLIHDRDQLREIAPLFRANA